MTTSPTPSPEASEMMTVEEIERIYASVKTSGGAGVDLFYITKSDLDLLCNTALAYHTRWNEALEEAAQMVDEMIEMSERLIDDANADGREYALSVHTAIRTDRAHLAKRIRSLKEPKP